MSGPQNISHISAAEGGQVFAGTVHGDVYYGNTARRESSALPAPPKPFSTVPFRRDPDFVDRGDILERIDRRCAQPAGRVALIGLGGVGERSPETWVFWVHTSNTARVETACREIADRLALPGRDENPASVLKLVASWLSNESNGKWLMVIDNADDLATIEARASELSEKTLVASLTPQCSHGAVLITSRNTDVAREMTGREHDIIRVGTMTQLEAERLLQGKLARPPDDDAPQLLEALEYFPLAISQAAAYINRQPRMSLSRYLNKLDKNESKTRLLLKAASDLRRDAQDQKASNSILATWQISFEQIRSEQPSAADLLSFISYFNRQGIPDFVLRRYKDDDTTTGEQERATLSSEDEDAGFEEDIAILDSFSLVTVTTSGDGYATHGLVQFATRVWLSVQGTEERWWGRYISAMESEHPVAEYENWPICRILLPHAHILSQRRPPATQRVQWVAVLVRAAQSLCMQGLYSQAENFAQQPLEVCEEFLGEHDDLTLAGLDTLGYVRGKQGRYREAEDLFRRELFGTVKVYGPNHLKTLRCMVHLALTLELQGISAEAEEMYRRALAGHEKKLGEGHIGTLTAMDNLAALLLRQGRYDEAEMLAGMALARSTEEFGADHPTTLLRLNTVSKCLRSQRKYEEAGAMARRSLEGTERTLGANHPDTLSCMSSLACILWTLRDEEEAVSLMETCVEKLKRVRGSDHYHTVRSIGFRDQWRRELQSRGNGHEQAEFEEDLRESK